MIKPTSVSCNMARTDQTKETQNTAKDLDHEDLDKELRVRSIRDRGVGAGNAHRHTAHQVAEADGEAAPEERVARHVVLRRPQAIVSVFQTSRDLGREDDRHNHTVDRDDLAKDNANQVLGRDARHAHTRTQDRGTRNEYTPSRTDDTQADAERNAHVRPHIGADAFQESADIKLVAGTWRELRQDLPVSTR